MEDLAVVVIPPQEILAKTAEAATQIAADYDPWWILGTVVTVVMLPFLVWLVQQLLSTFKSFMKHMIEAVDDIRQILTEQRIKEGILEEKVKNHISDDNSHCKGVACKMARE